MAQSTSRVSVPPDCTIPTRLSVSRPSAAFPGEGKRQAESCRRPSG